MTYFVSSGTQNHNSVNQVSQQDVYMAVTWVIRKLSKKLVKWPCCHYTKVENLVQIPTFGVTVW